MDHWQRCPNSTTYRSIDDPKDKFRSSYIDPISLTMVLTTPWQSSGMVSVSRRQVLEIQEGSFKALNQQAKKRLRAWILRIMMDKLNGHPDWKETLLADLDVDTIERDHLLNTIDFFIHQQAQGKISDDGYKVPMDEAQVQEVLEYFDVPAC